MRRVTETDKYFLMEKLGKNINGTIMKENVFQVLRKIYSKDIKLTIKVKEDFVFIDGSRKSLKWLAKIIDTFAEQDFEDDFWIKPKGPGSVYFKRNSTHGIYLYNTDFKKAKKSKKVASRSVTNR